MGNLKDYATGIVRTAPSPALSGTSLVLQTGEGDRMPATPFYATAHQPSEMPTLDNAEKVQVTDVTGDTLTIVRAQGDTTAKAIEDGWRISNTLFEADIPVINSTSVDAAGATMNSDTNVKTNSWVLDQDNMSGNDDTKVPTQQSVKAYVDAAIATAKQALLPVGSIVVLGVSTNPATLYGFGTWTAIEGRVLVGKAASGTFGTLDATGGAETHTLTVNELASHKHVTILPNKNVSAVTRNGAGIILNQGNGWYNGSAAYAEDPAFPGNANDFPPAAATGGNAPHNNLQPYVVKYMWQRTA